MGKIHVYCGDGKGKTTAAIGLSIRAAGVGYRVIFVQFLKSSRTGELAVLESHDKIEVIRSMKPLKFTFLMNEEEREECRNIHQEIWDEVMGKELTDTTLLVLDESIGTMKEELLDEEMVLEFLESHPECEVVLTGREPSERLMQVADYVTEMTKRKHPYDSNLPARKGIEF